MRRREELLALARADPEALVDYVLGLEERVRQWEARGQRLEARIVELEAQLASCARICSASP